MAFIKRDLGAHEFVVRGRTCVANVTLTVEPDDCPYDGDIPEDIAAYERGDFSMVAVVVTAWFDGEVSADDNLGGCCYSNASDIDDIVRDYGMVAKALADLARKVDSIVTKVAQ